MLHHAIQGLKTSLTATASQIFLVRIPFACTLREIEISIGAPVPSGGSITFDVNAGATAGGLASVFADPDDRPTIIAGASSVTTGGLDIALVKGWVTVDLDVLAGAGGITPPIFLSLTLDDGEPVGVTFAEADGSPSVLATSIIVGNGDLTDNGGGAVRLKTASDVVLPTALPPSGAAGGVLGGNYPNPTFATDMATQAELNSEATARAAADSALDVRLDALEAEGSAPSGAAAGDLGGTYPDPTVEQIRGRSLEGIPEPGVPLGDDFDDNSLDPDLWSQIDSGHAALEQNQRLELQPCAGTYSGVALDAQDFTDRYSAVKFVQQSNSDAMTMAWNFGAYTLHFLVRASGDLWPYIYGPSGFVTNGPQSLTVSAGMLLRVRHVSATDTFNWEYSTDGGAVWTLYHTFSGLGQSLASVTVHLRQYDAAGVAIFDSFSTDIGADDITGKDKFALAWDQGNARFGLMKLAGLAGLVSAAPSGAPSDVPAGYTALVYDQVNHRLYVRNPNTSQWDWVSFPNAL